MLDQNDIKTIGQIFEQSLAKFAGEVLKPSFDAIDERFNKVESCLGKVESRLENVEKKVDNLDATLHNQYPNKEYLDNKLADVVSEIGLRILKREEKEKNFKVFLVELLEKHSNYPKPELAKLKEMV